MASFGHVLVCLTLLQMASAYVAPPSSGSAARPAAVYDVDGEQVWVEVVEEPQQSQAWSPLALGAALGLMAAVIAGRAPAAMAADLENGENVFSGNCAACHAGGNNTVNAVKKLKIEALKEYGMYDVEKIKTQVTNGKNQMPAFGDKLAPDDIEDVANYVLSKADSGW